MCIASDRGRLPEDSLRQLDVERFRRRVSGLVVGRNRDGVLTLHQRQRCQPRLGACCNSTESAVALPFDSLGTDVVDRGSAEVEEGPIRYVLGFRCR